jgi:hypothetical protein
MAFIANPADSFGENPSTWNQSTFTSALDWHQRLKVSSLPLAFTYIIDKKNCQMPRSRSFIGPLQASSLAKKRFK